MYAPKKRDGTGRTRARFLEAYRQTGNIVAAARIAGMRREQHYRWLDTDPDYAREFDSARRQAADILESEAIRRGVEGTRELVLANGKPVRDPQTGDYLYRHKYSDVLLIFLLKGLLPEKYRETFVPVGDDDGVRIAGRPREEVIREEIAARQAVLDALTRAKEQHGKNGKASG